MQRRITSTGVIVVRSNWGWRNRMEDAYVLQLLEPKFKEFHLLFCGYASVNRCIVMDRQQGQIILFIM